MVNIFFFFSVFYLAYFGLILLEVYFYPGFVASHIYFNLHLVLIFIATSSSIILLSAKNKTTLLRKFSLITNLLLALLFFIILSGYPNIVAKNSGNLQILYVKHHVHIDSIKNLSPTLKKICILLLILNFDLYINTINKFPHKTILKLYGKAEKYRLSLYIYLASFLAVFLLAFLPNTIQHLPFANKTLFSIIRLLTIFNIFGCGVIMHFSKNKPTSTPLFLVTATTIAVWLVVSLYWISRMFTGINAYMVALVTTINIFCLAYYSGKSRT